MTCHDYRTYLVGNLEQKKRRRSDLPSPTPESTHLSSIQDRATPPPPSFKRPAHQFHPFIFCPCFIHIWVMGSAGADPSRQGARGGLHQGHSSAYYLGFWDKFLWFWFFPSVCGSLSQPDPRPPSRLLSCVSSPLTLSSHPLQPTQLHNCVTHSNLHCGSSHQQQQQPEGRASRTIICLRMCVCARACLPFHSSKENICLVILFQSLIVMTTSYYLRVIFNLDRDISFQW